MQCGGSTNSQQSDYSIDNALATQAFSDVEGQILSPLANSHGSVLVIVSSRKRTTIAQLDGHFEQNVTSVRLLRSSAHRAGETNSPSEAMTSQAQPPIRIPAPDFAASMNKIRNELEHAHSLHAPYSISSIISHLPLEPNNSLQLPKLQARGNLLFGLNDHVVNNGRPLDVTFKDGTIGSIQLSLPAHVAAKISGGSDDMAFAFNPSIVAILQGLAIKYNIAPNELLDSIEMTSKSVEYDFHSGSNKADQTTLIIELAGSSHVAM
jgi:hypothetical protein